MNQKENEMVSILIPIRIMGFGDPRHIKFHGHRFNITIARIREYFL